MPQGFEHLNHTTPAGFEPTHGESAVDRAIRKSTAGDILYNNRIFIEARELYTQADRLQPGNARLLWLMGMCSWQMGEIDEAGKYLQASVATDPNFHSAHAVLGRWYLLLGKIDLALESTAKGISLAPQDDECIMGRAWVLEAAGELDEAWVLIQELVAKGYAPHTVAPLYSRMAQARGEPEKALALVSALLSSKGLSRVAIAELYFSAASLLDTMGRYDQAFEHAAMGNKLTRRPYDPASISDVFDSIIKFFSPDRISSMPRASHCDDRPVFIVGMPRSGTSLVEQILASHPEVHGAGERDFMQRTFLATLGSACAKEEHFPECLKNVPAEDLNRLAQVYLRPLTALNPSARRITDKMPTNFMHVGLISMLLPGAKIIHCRRDPMDTCLSCYLTSFNFGHEFKNDLTHLGLFYRDYQRLMQHYKSVLPIPILDVDYEQLVADPRGQTRVMLDFLGLPWDERCARFHESKRHVATASVEQVRKPIYKSSVQRWRHYETHLGPLKAALGISKN